MSHINISYESLPPRDLKDEDLLKIFEIEQDMWARGIWEYIRCDECESIFSKEDIYGKKWNLDLLMDLQKETVMQIEGIIWLWCPDCPTCQWQASHIYSMDDYIPKIEKRFMRDEAFLSVAKKSWEIIWFMDWYIANLEEIFQDEFSYHFSDDVLDQIMDRYRLYRKQKMLTVASIGTDDKNKNLTVVFSLLRIFFWNIDDDLDNISWIVESIVWSTTYCIFNLMWADWMKMQNKSFWIIEDSVNREFKTDILFQKGVVWKYKRDFNLQLRDVLIYFKSLQMQGVHL